MKHIVPLLVLFFLSVSVSLSAQSSFDNNDRSVVSQAALELKLFPNPAVDYFSLSENQIVERVLIFNLVGRQMKNFKARSREKYNIADLPKGMYLVQLLNKQQDIITTQRLHKQ